MRRRLLPGLELNAIALMAASGITALVGLAFWALAARLPPAEVGRASAVISTATMLAQLASANVGVLFSRVLAVSGARSRRLVLTGYGCAAGIGALLGTGFVLVGPDDALLGSWVERVTFPLLVVLFGIFVLQDWVLIGLRASTWVPVEQLLFALGKLGLLVLFGALALDHAIVLAWTIPCLLAVLVVNPLLFGRALVRRPPPPEGAGPMPTRAGLRRIFLAEYATGAVTVVVPLVLPLLVVAQLGTEANAYYALPWLIAEALGVLLWNISSSYMVEASHDGRDTAALMRRTIRLSALVLGVGVPVVVVTAPWLLSVLGSDYAAQGTTVLRLMVLSVPFSTVIMLYVNTARLHNRMGRVVAVQCSSAVLVIGLATVLLGRLGVDGAGWASLVAEGTVAAVVVVPLIRMLRAERAAGGPPAPPAPTAGAAADGVATRAAG